MSKKDTWLSLRWGLGDPARAELSGNKAHSYAASTKATAKKPAKSKKQAKSKRI